MTERLYYTDPYLTEFEANVLTVNDVGGRSEVVLDRTAFYPTSGGQPFDTGSLGAARVVDVVDRDDGAIVHVVEGEVATGGVVGRIDWARRFDHMQQHTAQHILSAAFERTSGARTMSFHLGAVAATIDLSREVSAAEIDAAEDAANALIWEDRAITIRFVDADSAAALPLRKEPARTGTLRIVEVEGFDVSACGGTHVARTGGAGMVAVSGWERFRGGTRLEFRAGGRALRAQRTLRDTVAAGIRLLSVAGGELPQGIERLQAENKDVRRRTKDLEARLTGYEADALAGSATAVGPMRVVAAAVPDLDMNGLKTLAQTLAARPGHAVILSTAGSPASVVVARAGDLPMDAAQLLKQLTAQFGGKGGGRPELAQGGGLTGTPKEILDRALQILRQP